MTTTLDETRAAAFEERLLDVINDGALTLMISVGHRTGLFDAMVEAGPLTIPDLAKRADCDERYVQEWLGALTVGAIVDHDPDSRTYTLPDEHARLLSRRSPTENFAVFAQYVPLLAGIEDDIVECFRHGGGVPYARVPRFQEVMEEESSQSVLPVLEDHILPLVPGLTDRLAAGIRVVDVGCGRGRALQQLASSYPASTFVGIDLSEDAVAHATARAADAGLANLTFVAGDAALLDDRLEPGSIDLALSFDAIHDQVDPDAMLRGIHTALAPDGTYLAQDIDGSSTHDGDRDNPIGPLLYTISTFHCMTVSLAGDGAGLGAMWGRERALEHFHRAGFGDVEVHTLEHDPQNAYYVCRP